MNRPKLYGKLEEIANHLEPDRSQILFFLGTLHKHTVEEKLDCIRTQTSWLSYSRETAENLITKKITNNNFFSSLEKNNHKQWKHNKGYSQTTRSNEIFLDLDDQDSWDNAIVLCKQNSLHGRGQTWTGSKGGHIILIFNGFVTPEFRNKVRTFFNADMFAINPSVAGKPHHRTGSTVLEVWYSGGLNNIDNFLGGKIK